MIMSNNTSSNKAAVPEAKGALNRFKFEVANELGVPLTDGYNGNLTSKQCRWLYGEKDDRGTGKIHVRRTEWPEWSVLIQKTPD